MKNDELLQIIKNAYQSNPQRIDRLFSFLSRHKKIVEEFNIRSTTELVISCKSSPRDMLYKIFLDSMRASGGNNLSATEEGCDEFIEMFSLLEIDANSKLCFADVLKKSKLDSTINETTTKEFFYKELSTIKNFKHKKAALLMKALYYLQSSEEYAIFYDLSPDAIYKPIPLDIVIAEILSIALGLKWENRIIPARDFDAINQWARDNDKLDNYYLIEHIWFWGYFNTITNKEGYRDVKENNAKYITNPWFFPIKNPSLKKCFSDFCEIVS